jgi:uncharacterized protein YbaA (DUF1428 family)
MPAHGRLHGGHHRLSTGADRLGSPGRAAAVHLRHLRACSNIHPFASEVAAMSYVDGFVVPVHRDRLGEYRKLARKAGKIWMEFGALAYCECVGDDVPVGKLTSFPRSVKLKPDEVVVFSWIVYTSRAQRDRINKKIMADPRLAAMMDPKNPPFDFKRMFFGGFKPIVTY